MDDFLAIVGALQITESFIFGAGGSFVRECAHLRKVLQEEEQTKGKIKILCFLPVWVLAGGIVGGVTGTMNLEVYHAFFSGAAWRVIITNSKQVVHIIANTTSQLTAEKAD